MSDFTDDEDRQLVNFALAFLRNGPHILWDQLTQLMKGTKKPKEALRQRLKTLKRTHGRNLEAFPAWFFKAELTTETNPHQLRASRRPGACAKAATRERDKAVLRSTKTRYKPRARASSTTATKSNSTGGPTKTTTKLKKSAKPNMPPRFPKYSATLKMESCSSSLLLLASVASSSGHAGKEMTDSRCARVAANQPLWSCKRKLSVITLVGHRALCGIPLYLKSSPSSQQRWSRVGKTVIDCHWSFFIALSLCSPIEPMKTPVACGDEETTIDSTSWPTNRLSYIELSSQDKATIEKLFEGRSDTPLLMKWVMLHKSGSKFRPRLLVISTVRLWVLKQQKVFSKALVLRREHQLMHVQKLTALRSRSPSVSCSSTSSTISIRLVILPKQANGYCEETVMLHFDPGTHTESFVRLLQRLLYALRLTFPQQQPPPVRLPPDCHWYEFFPDEKQPPSENQDEECQIANSTTSTQQNPLFGAMATAYRAFCDDLGVRFRDSVPTRLEECASTSGCMDFQYCLGFPRGVNGYEQHEHPQTPLQAFMRAVVDACFPSSAQSVASFQSKEIQALVRTLECSRCFTDIVISDLAMGHASLAILFQSLLSPICTIEGLTLSNVQLSVRALRTLQGVTQEIAMRQSNCKKKLSLKCLDFSFNRFTVAMATELATILHQLHNGLELLQLERCGLSMVSSCRIVEALSTTEAFGVALLELNLAGNHLGLEGTNYLATWITRTRALQRLDVSRTQLDINIFAQALKLNTMLHESSLVHLELSYNQMRTQASEDLGVILGKSKSLTTIILRGMKRYRHFHRLLPPQLQKEGTLLALSEAAVVAQTAAARRNGRTVHRADGLRKQFLRNILAPMFANTDRDWDCTCMVDLSDNDLSGHRAEVLAKLLDESPWATRMSLRLDHSRLHDDSAVLLLHSIRGCKTLASLSLEGNGFIKRNAHRQRQLQNEKCYSHGVAPSNPSESEQAGANALAIMLGGVLDCNNYHNTTSRLGTREATISAMHSSAAKPLRLKELSLKCQGCYVFGTHIVTAAVHALAKPNAQLRMLDVTGNACGDALAQALGEMLPKNKSLQALYWDGNCITVDGFHQFYDGLLQNHTLIMVEMPIQDTRRILEEQQDPPREKLFSILGKIFKITERNQILAKEAKERRAEAHSARGQTLVSVDRRRENHIKCDEAHPAQAADPIELEMKRELESAGLALEKCPSPKLAIPTEDDDDDEEDVDLSSARSSARRSLSRQTSARYPTSMQSWTRQSSGGDFITQLNELDSLTSSFSRTPSHM